MLDNLLVLTALFWGVVLNLRFPVLAQNVFDHPSETLILLGGRYGPVN